jgi:phosphatidylserine decarboxylase
MKFAKGSKILITNSFLVGIIFFVLFLFFRFMDISFIFLLISVSVFLISIFLLIFFRDPERTIGKDIVACADGKIKEITMLKDKDIGDCVKVSTFMNIYNVHINRMPLDGSIIKINHSYGYHIPAFSKDSEKNEKMITIIDTNIGKIKITQIAGCLARRIVTYVKLGDNLKKGDRFGIIRLGSKVDLFLPSKKIQKVLVKVGDMVKAGETPVGKTKD